MGSVRGAGVGSGLSATTSSPWVPGVWIRHPTAGRCAGLATTDCTADRLKEAHRMPPKRSSRGPACPSMGGYPRARGGELARVSFSAMYVAAVRPLSGGGGGVPFGTLDGSKALVSLGFSCGGVPLGTVAGLRSRLTVATPTPINFAIARCVASMAASFRAIDFR